MSVLNKHCLVLNAGWFAIGTCTVSKAISDMYIGSKKPVKIEYLKDSEGNYDFDKPTEIMPLDWNSWEQLSPREYDDGCIRTPKMNIRIPTVVITPNYKANKKRTYKLNNNSLYEHYKGVDYWTGEVISRNSSSKDHVKARSKSGDNSWHNIALTSKKINYLKGDMEPEEFMKKYGYKPHYKLTEPKPVDAQSLIKILERDWAFFILKERK
jgi:hypothetical protein